MESGEGAGTSRRNSRLPMSSFSKRKVQLGPLPPRLSLCPPEWGVSSGPQGPWPTAQHLPGCVVWQQGLGLQPGRGWMEQVPEWPSPDPHWPMP